MYTLRQKIISGLLIGLTLVVLIASVIASGFSKQYDLKLNDIAPENIYASRDIIDTVSTNALREDAAKATPEKYTINAELTLSKYETLNNFISSVKNAKSSLETYEALFEKWEKTEKESYTHAFLPRDEDSITPRPTAPVIDYTSTGLTKESFDLLLTLSEEDYNFVLNTTPSLFQQIMSSGVTDTKEGANQFKVLLSEESVSQEAKDISFELVSALISPNKFYNEAETLKDREAAKASVEDIKFKKNQLIVGKGSVIDEAKFTMLSELGLIKGSGSIDIFHTTSVTLLLLLSMALIVIYYIILGCRELKVSPIIVSIICSALTIIGALIIFLATRVGEKIMYLIPLSMIPALIALLLNANMASMVNILVSVLAGIQTNDLSLAVCLVIAGCATSYAFSKVVRRTHLLYATAASAFAYALAHTAIFIGTSQNVANILFTFAFAFLGGFFGGILTIGTIPFWEAIFDVITPMKLGELSNPEHKLLKKLLIKAPGSYHHALTVANMADAAADAIDANALLARVGAYYHDIGKMKNPYYFKENQFADSNPHDELLPEESARVIIDHVADGAALAEQYHLPTAVKDIILQHHGTTTASYFLYKAKEKNPNIDPSIFTYDGPTPISKEATIIMLADACEAAVRAMREKGYADVASIVDDIVASRINDGQLASSELTFADLKLVKASFVQTLEQYFHKRILYPQNKKN